MHRILVADDDPHIREVICFALRKAGMEPVSAATGAEALASARADEPALIVLDIGMPEMDGLDVCRTLRKTSDVPILFLSARDEEIDRIVGLEIGADDYVTKPFSPRELVARVNAILKRGRAAPAAPALTHGALRVDPETHSAAFEGRDLALTATELAILFKLMRRPEAVLSRNQIMDAAYGPAIHVSDRTIDSHIRNIRAKLAAFGCEDGVATIHGVGFRLGSCRRPSA
ncbi:response regulator transcription factor [Enterovirga rhinocerotis]|uniref:Two-component system OmpR family response regulator n=1 Tax=Enterovirga rhinocerotis TaxID=1339210 RepID=A0A4R7BVH7_9HYPH|nr:response regulator transcription factor [Enterovirga rhinocerotis]TDR89834.1 two-component system OmpR family response regulator [Enterovirga rhinocerotis]